jgi:signal peptidase I
MTPTIPTGSLVIVLPADPLTMRPGEVITYQKAPGVAEFETHRIVAVHRDTNPVTFTTKGDNNPKPDVSPVPVGAVRGKVWVHAPYLGFVSDVVKTPRGMVLVLGLLALVWVVPVIVRQLGSSGEDADVPVELDHDEQRPVGADAAAPAVW